MNYNLNLKDIVDRYSEPHRHYHNWNHIQYMLDKFNKIKNREKIKGCIDKEAIYYAILFHDIIYDPKSKTNEEDSANYLKEVFDKLDDQDISAKTIDIARYAIFASKNHLAEPYPVAYQTGIEIFLDLDLAILAEPKLDVYKQYADNIRKEYYFVPDEEFRWHSMLSQHWLDVMVSLVNVFHMRD